MTIWILPFEEVSRTNGFTAAQDRYDEELGKQVPDGHFIVLAAKRIPPHPAMTRYLVAHEYGHAVEDWIWQRRGDTDHGSALKAEYSRMRRLPEVANYGGGTWHRSPNEVMACDFRLTIAGVESEFWPHPGISRPGKAVRRWWERHRG